MAPRTRLETSDPAGSQTAAADGSPQRQRLLSAALELFAERGVEATSLRMVAGRAGASLGALSHYYPSKAALVSAAHGYVLERMRRTLADASGDSSVARAEGVTGAALLALRRRDAYYDMLREEPAIAGYLRREWLSPRAEFVLQELAMDEEERQAFLQRDFPRPPRDPDVSLLLHRLVGMIPLLFAPVIETALGIDVMSPDGIRRWHAAELELLLGTADADPEPASAQYQGHGRPPATTRRATTRPGKG
jgi:AcrR family transcriptional regulator